MVDEIEITINQGSLKIIELIIFPKKLECYACNKKYTITEEIITKILGILSTWKYETGSLNAIDSEEFEIKVTSNGEETIYHGNGMYPDNYEELKDLIYGVING